MSDEQMRVLEMIRDGKVTPEEGARLLEALRPGPRAADGRRGRLGESAAGVGDMVSRIVSGVMEAVSASGNWSVATLRGLERKREREETGWVDIPIDATDGDGFTLPRSARLLVESEGGGLEVVQEGGVDTESASDAAEGRARITFEGEGHNWDYYAKRRDDEHVVAVYRTENPARVPRMRLAIPPVTDLRAHTSGGGVRVDGVTSPCDVKTSGGGITAERVAGPLAAKTSGGGITARQCTGALELKTSGGGITVEDATSPVEAHTSGGSVRVTGTPPRIDLKTSGGSIHFSGLTQSFDARTSGGAVTIEGARLLEGEHEARTAAGSLKLLLTRDSNVDIDASTTAGRISIELPGMHGETRGGFGGSRYTGIYGGGGAKLTLRTSAGSVYVGTLDTPQ